MNFGVILHWRRLFRLVVLNVLNSHTGGVDCGIIDSIGGQTWLRRAYELAANEKASYACLQHLEGLWKVSMVMYGDLKLFVMAAAMYSVSPDTQIGQFSTPIGDLSQNMRKKVII